MCASRGRSWVTRRSGGSARLTAAKATPERAWLAEVSSVVLQQALADLNAAYRNFFSSATGKRAGPRAAPPRFRSRKDGRQAARFTRNARFAVTPAGRLRLPKIGDVPVRWSRALPARRLRDDARPGRQRSPEHSHGGTRRDPKCLRRRRETRARPGGCQRNRNPPRCRMSGTAGIPAPSGPGGRQDLKDSSSTRPTAVMAMANRAWRIRDLRLELE